MPNKEYESYDDYYKRYNSGTQTRQSTYIPPTSPSWPLSTTTTTTPEKDHPAFIAACFLGTLAALIDIVWLAVPTAKYIYSEFPSAEALDIFAQCLLGGLGYVLGGMVLLTVIAKVFGLFMKVLRAI